MLSRNSAMKTGGALAMSKRTFKFDMGIERLTSDEINSLTMKKYGLSFEEWKKRNDLPFPEKEMEQLIYNKTAKKN